MAFEHGKKLTFSICKSGSDERASSADLFRRALGRCAGGFRGL
jgi:hypothetical protein